MRRFADMEIFVEILENVRGEDVFVIQSTSYPANDHLMELLIIIDALRRASARRITAVLPYFGYARQDRKSGSRTPISAKLVANLITNAGADRVLTLDLHAGQIQGFFDIPTDNLFASPVMVRDITRALRSRQSSWSYRLTSAAWCAPARLPSASRRRSRSSTSGASAPANRRSMNVIGDVAGYTCILVDDIVDSGGTLVNAADALLEKGATTSTPTSPTACSRAARWRESPRRISRNWSSPTRSSRPKRCESPTTSAFCSIASLIGEAIARTAEEKSVSSLFDVNFLLIFRTFPN